MMRNSRKAMLDNAHKEMMERCSKVDYEIIINKKCEHCKDGNVIVKYFNIAVCVKATELIMDC